MPHSDPVMDGGVIQQASSAALEAGATPADVIATVREAALDIPVAVMTYVNPVLRRGVDAFLDEATQAGVSGMIVPDLPVDEAEAFERGMRRARASTPCCSPPRGRDPRGSPTIATARAGFVYCVATYGVTGARAELGTTAQSWSRPCGRSPTCRCWSASASARPRRRAEACGVRRRGDRGQRPHGAAWSTGTATACSSWSATFRAALPLG